jgi:hypothetical protein
VERDLRCGDGQPARDEAAVTRTAALLLWFNGLGFGIPCLMAIRSLLAGRGIIQLLGFPAYGHGPFERHGIPSTAGLISGFLLVCALECVAGLLLWGGHKSGAILALALLPLGAIYWWGFALPIPPMFAVARTIAIVVAWRVLT